MKLLSKRASIDWEKIPDYGYQTKSWRAFDGEFFLFVIESVSLSSLRTGKPYMWSVRLRNNKEPLAEGTAATLEEAQSAAEKNLG